MNNKTDSFKKYVVDLRRPHAWESLLKSAEAWAGEGLKELKLAGDAVRIQNHNTAENHRKNAAQAFECEISLRKLSILPEELSPLTVCRSEQPFVPPLP